MGSRNLSGFLSIFFIAFAIGIEQNNDIKYPFIVDVIDLALATCLFFLSVFGVLSIAIGRTPDKTRVVVAAKSVPFSAANSKLFFKSLESKKPLKFISLLF